MLSRANTLLTNSVTNSTSRAEKVEKETAQPASGGAEKGHSPGGEQEAYQETKKKLLKKVNQSSLDWRRFSTSSNTSSAVSSLSQVVVINTLPSANHTPHRCRPHHPKGPDCRIYLLLFFFHTHLYIFTLTFSVTLNLKSNIAFNVNGHLTFGDKHKTWLEMNGMSVICW